MNLLDVFLSLKGHLFEHHVASIVEQELAPAGFEVIRWTKLPYLCEGDFNKVFTPSSPTILFSLTIISTMPSSSSELCPERPMASRGEMSSTMNCDILRLSKGFIF